MSEEAPLEISNSKEPLHVSVADSLAHEILDGQWLPGYSKKLEDIQAQFDISRTVAREATRLLSSLRCVQFQRGTGVIACAPDLWDDMSTRVIAWKLYSPYREDELRALTELRLAIEPAAAAGCAQRASIQERTHISATGIEMVKAAKEGKIAQFHQLDIQFHTLMLKHSGNPLFADLSGMVETVLRGRVEINMFPQKPDEKALKSHEQVAHAILMGEPQAASEAMKAIVSEVNSALGLAAL
ncbi:FadR family transcriptional regulator [Alloscardovia theropitheci]|uniref:FadR family transcriptional regulator n=1 Tax=Alloscardovia theropitheci TaxID=2496842 RepID=A0A4R0QQ25_9BIFI|nr:FCD domain-containing protein [Alloscardovia theropitheci]TCD54382.1 FadR family transcriptional regulator [Alloscardovia theropitheci]